MTFDGEAFRAYFKRHKLAREGIVDDYMKEHPREEYHYEDIDAVYQRQINEVVSRKDVHSQSEMLPHGKHYYALAGGGKRTISGTKGGDQR